MSRVAGSESSGLKKREQRPLSKRDAWSEQGDQGVTAAKVRLLRYTRMQSS